MLIVEAANVHTFKRLLDNVNFSKHYVLIYFVFYVLCFVFYEFFVIILALSLFCLLWVHVGLSGQTWPLVMSCGFYH